MKKKMYCTQCGRELVVSKVSAYGYGGISLSAIPGYDRYTKYNEKGEEQFMTRYRCPKYIRIIGIKIGGHESYAKEISDFDYKTNFKPLNLL